MSMKFTMRAQIGMMVGTLAMTGGLATTQAAAAQAAAQANNTFTLDLYSQLRIQPGNLFFSPYSISTALAMAYAGAKGETAAQMERTLHFDSDQKIHVSLAALLKQLNEAGRNKGMELNIANGLWAQEGHPFLPNFLDIARDQYGAKVEQADFKNSAEQVRTQINQWVEAQTRNRIQNLLPAGSVDPLMRIILANAIYFKGVWAKPFQTSQTVKETFYVSTAHQKSTPLMHHFDQVNYTENDQWQAIEMPYAGGELAMLVLLPRDKDGLPKVEQGLTSDSISGLANQMRRQRVEIFLPRFKLDSGLALKDILTAMGMRVPFSGNSDFSGMDGTRDLYISEVFHKAWCQVNEEGTEAAAATGVLMPTRAVGPSEKPPVFRADHPFVFIIRDVRSGAFLFMGRMAVPQE